MVSWRCPHQHLYYLLLCFVFLLLLLASQDRHPPVMSLAGFIITTYGWTRQQVNVLLSNCIIKI